jgi:uncharacterized iron-regulated membrane protein
MASARVRLFWIKIHRWLGLSALLFLFIAAVTGCFLCFDKQIDAALNSDLFTHASPGPTVDPALLVATLQTQRPDLVVTSFPLNLRPNENLKIDVAPRVAGADLGFDEIFIDASTGRVAGTRKIGPGWDRRHFVEGVFQFHQNLVAGTWGRWIMGVAALAWLIGNFVGVYLTLPAKKPFWPKWKKKWKIDTGARLRRFMLELHNSSGLWLLIPATILAYTSVAMNFFDEAFVPAVEATSPSRPSIFDAPAKALPPGSTEIGFAQALAIGTAKAAADGLKWKPALQRYNPGYHAYGVTFTDNGVENYHGLGPITYYLDASNGRLIERDDPYSDSLGRKLVRSLYPLHSGEIAGWLGIAIIFLLGLSTTEMCVTGFYTWWKKRESRAPSTRAARKESRRLSKA